MAPADQPPSVEVVVVRGARLPPSPADAAFSIIRLGPEALERAPRLDGALTGVPGVSLFRRTSSLGANPTTQGVSLRGIAGSGASRALVTLDGVPQNDPFGGWVTWTRLPPETIAGVVIVRGAGAGPYGAGALTGVVALDEAAFPRGHWTGGATFATLGQARGAFAGEFPAGPGALFVSGAAEHSDGWTPVRQGRGAADEPLTLDDHTVAARFDTALGAATGALRVSAYKEDRSAGLAGAGSRARGASASATAASAPSPAGPGWRAQAWAQVSDLANRSVSVAPDRSSTSPTNDQYETPAIGYGVGAAARWLAPVGSLEVGVDARGAAGESREHFRPVDGVLSADRRAGGQTLTGGLYGEATRDRGPWLLVAGARLDGWGQFDSHRLERGLATGATTLDLHPPARGGALPSARLAARFDASPALFARAAAYSGFRAPTLNELYRPFRVGNDITEANAELTPERLYGAELGAGGSAGPARWSATAFYNRLDGAITNVTVAFGPLFDPVAGFIPAGGVLRQRRNAGAVGAYGVEAQASARLSGAVTARAALSWTHARVDGGAAAPGLTGLRPAETPALSVDGAAVWTAAPRLEFEADLRYESARFDDDLNLRRLAPAATVGARAQWRLTRAAAVFIAAENLFDVAVANGETATGVTSYGPPRTVAIGLTVSGP